MQLTPQPELNALVFEDVQKRKEQEKFEHWLARWRRIAWSNKKDETELPAFINSNTRSSESEIQDVNNRPA